LPIQHLFDLRPVGDIVKFNQTQRRAGHDQSIEVFTLNIIEVAVEVVQMLRRRVTRLTGIDPQQLNINLQREFDSRRRNWFSVSIFFGIRLRISTFSGRIS
jgi:hypothetical protein